eukprot:GGOE01036772.1.p2 GENE.GGOE01036772.1~~GGOE01036772.1.p2  ORF type:complete len:186 (-),score=57.63 GGOE01036772.1:165-722(-)
MQVLNDNVALLSNLEVGDLLREEAEAVRREVADKRVLQFQSKLRGYLGAAGQLPEEKALEFLRRAEPYGLTPGELLNILNLRPKCFCHLFAIVEAPDERLSSDQIAKLLDLCQDCFNLEDTAVAASQGAPGGEQHTTFGKAAEPLPERLPEPPPQLWTATPSPLSLEEAMFSFVEEDPLGDLGED